MIKIYVGKQSNYPVNASKLKSKLRSFLKSKGIVSDSVVNVSIIGEKKMKEISKKFLGDKEVHNVLTFTEAEMTGNFVYPKDGVIRLGEIIICYTKVVEEAKMESKLIEEKVYELVEHGARHLLGEHHE